MQVSSSVSARTEPTPPASLKHKQGYYNTEWEKKFPVYLSNDGKRICIVSCASTLTCAMNATRLPFSVSHLVYCCVRMFSMTI